MPCGLAPASIMSLRFPLVATLITLTVLLAALGIAIAFGGPKVPPPMASINDPFRNLDFSNLPPVARYKGSDGASLSYRAYMPIMSPPRGSVVLIHGSSASSTSMHVLAEAFAKAGYSAYALDIRGHGNSGSKGKISYVGQLEDDLAVFVREVAPTSPATLVGFSSGGGFALRFGSGGHQDKFQSYLLLSPFLGPDAPTHRPGSGGWVNVGVPRIIALSVLNTLGIRAFNGLPVASFALNEEARKFLTPEYSFSLAANFAPHRDYEKDIKSVRRPCAVLAGANDEAFVTAELEPLFRALGQQWSVRLLPGVGHIALTLDPKAVGAAVSAVEVLQTNGVSSPARKPSSP